MPAGDQVSLNGHVELRGNLTGTGTPYQNGGNLTGLGVPQPKTNDTELGHAAGSYLGRDYTGMRIITIPYALEGTPAVVGDNLWTLAGIWAASQTDLPLHMQLDGYGHISVNGRPRGLVDDLSDLNLGFVRALATFACGDPTIYRTPRAPTMGTATAGAGQATASWTAPADNGGSPVTGYELTTYRASDAAVLFVNQLGLVLTYTRTGLAAGVPVYFKVAAKNTVGTGPQSAASNTVTPT